MKPFSILPILGLFILATGADVTPPDTMQINVTYNNEKIDSVFHAQLLACMSEERIERIQKYIEITAEQLAMKELDPDGNCYWYPAYACHECTDSTCYFEFGNFSTFKLAVYVPQLDKVFVSDKIEIEKRESFYAATLLPDGTIDMRKIPKITGRAGISEHKIVMFVKALGITLLIELIIAFIYSMGRTAIPKYSKKQIRFLSTVFLANIISLPILWFIFFSIMNSFFMVVLGEAFVLLFEGALLHFWNKPVLSMKDALLFSFILNVGSFFLGYPLYCFLLF